MQTHMIKDTDSKNREYQSTATLECGNGVIKEGTTRGY